MLTNHKLDNHRIDRTNDLLYIRYQVVSFLGFQLYATDWIVVIFQLFPRFPNQLLHRHGKACE